jgi:hypothetical protein
MLSTTGFGLNGGSKSALSRRSVPSHLRNNRFSNPGPGTYNARSSV